MSNELLLTTSGGTVELPREGSVLVPREDGGHLIVNPPRPVWERSELTRDELIAWSLLVAAAGQAMIESLPQLKDGCVNYWEAGNWALHDDAAPRGRKRAREHRSVHLHIFGRSPRAADPSWQWGEAPSFPRFHEREQWASRFERLNRYECDTIVRALESILRDQYAMR